MHDIKSLLLDRGPFTSGCLTAAVSAMHDAFNGELDDAVLAGM